MSINSELLRLSKTPAFQKRVQTEYAAAKKAGKPFGVQGTGSSIGSFSLGSIDPATAQQYIDKIILRVEAVVTQHFPGTTSGMFNIVGPIPQPDGKSVYQLSFKPHAVHRESLYSQGYPEGLTNVVMLYSHGGKPNRHAVYEGGIVRGRSNKHVSFNHGRYLPKGYTIHPDPFLRDCIAAINAEMAKDGVTVTLNPVYYP